MAAKKTSATKKSSEAKSPPATTASTKKKPGAGATTATVASKKTPKAGPSKDSVDDSSSSSTSAKVSNSRPLAVCPLPEHLRVDLESAQTENLKALIAPSAPLPRFSSRALEHGMKAVGATGLRKGFAWNSQMDLAWALGYPKMTFIVDGAVENDSKEALLAFFGKTLEDAENEAWFSTIVGDKNLVPRRAAFALLHELGHEENPLELSEKKFIKATEPKELSSVDVATLLKKTQPQNVERMALLLESLTGPSAVVSALCDVFERVTNAKSRVKIARVLRALTRRVPQKEFDAVYESLAKSDPEYMSPLREGMTEMQNGNTSSAIDYLQWVDGVEDEVLLSFRAYAAEGVGDVPFPRYAYAGGEELLAEQVAIFEKYMDGPVVFFREYSTIRHPLLLGPALLARSHKLYREAMTQWFESHADYYRPLLQALVTDPKLGKHASDVLKAL